MSFNSSRNGSDGSASGQEEPDTLTRPPKLRSSRATTGLIAVFPDNSLRVVDRHAPVVVDGVVHVDLPRRPVLAGACHPGPCARDAVHEVADQGRVRQAGSHDVSRRDLLIANRYLLCGVEPQHVQRLEHADEIVAQAVLERDTLRVQPAWHQENLFMLHVHALHRADAGREDEGLRLAERLVVNHPRPFSQMTGGFRHSSIVVQIEKLGQKS